MTDINRDAAIRALEQLKAVSRDGWDFSERNSAIGLCLEALKALPLAAPATESQSPLMNDEARLEGRQGKPDAAVPQVPLRETPPVSAATPAPCKALSGGTCDCFDPAAPVAHTAPTAWQPMATAPKDRDVFWLVMPKTADETYTDTSGRPITSDADPRCQFSKHGRWSSLEKAIGWYEPNVPALPAPPPDDRQAQKE